MHRSVPFLRSCSIVRAATFLALLLGPGVPASAQPLDRIPFEPLQAPDTLRTRAALDTLRAHCDVVDASTRQVSRAPEEANKAPWAVLVRPFAHGWLAFPLPGERSLREGSSVLGITPDSRFVRIACWSNASGLGFEKEESELVFVDIDRATSVTLTTRTYERTWSAEDPPVTRSFLDSTHVEWTGSLLVLSPTCYADGRAVPCAIASRAYALTPEALVLDAAIDVQPATPATSGPPPPLQSTDLFPLTTTQRLCPRLYAPGAGIAALDSADRIRWLQDEAPHYARSELYLFARLPASNGLRIAMLCDQGDDHDLLWLAYDQRGLLVGLDTLASQFGDGQDERSECAYIDTIGVLMIEAVDRITLRDEADTMAYLCDTLRYEVRVRGEERRAADGIERTWSTLERVPHDLTARWVERHGTNERGPYAWRSVNALLPTGTRVLQAASGDLNGDGLPDHAFVLTNAEDDGDRDLFIAFTKRDASGFVQHAMVQGMLPGRASGGFHDPIGEEGLSGLSIRGDSLVIAQFGGSAWKWHIIRTYRYDGARDAFFLVEERARQFHAPTDGTLYDELKELEAVRAQGSWSAEQTARHAELKKLEADFAWHVTRYAIGERRMRAPEQ